MSNMKQKSLDTKRETKKRVVASQLALNPWKVWDVGKPVLSMFFKSMSILSVNGDEDCPLRVLYMWFPVPVC
jgi:hypothetical protein